MATFVKTCSINYKYIFLMKTKIFVYRLIFKMDYLSNVHFYT